MPGPHSRAALLWLPQEHGTQEQSCKGAGGARLKTLDEQVLADAAVAVPQELVHVHQGRPARVHDCAQVAHRPVQRAERPEVLRALLDLRAHAKQYMYLV